MTAGHSTMPSPLSRWSARLALFGVLLVITAMFLHRVFALSTPAAFNLLAAAYAGAALAVVIGCWALIGVWRRDTPGASRIVLGLVLGGIVLATPLALMIAAAQHPMLNDVTTDPRRPPAFVALARERTGWANPAAYPGESFAAIQREGFPDLQPIIVNRSVLEAYEIVLEALDRQQLTLVVDVAPSPEQPEGRIEAFDRTLILGFYDDVAVRVSPTEAGARIDLRSSSRYGRSDFGRNATRLRDIMREIVARLEATVPAAEPELVDTPNQKTVKRPKNETRDPSRPRKQ